MQTRRRRHHTRRGSLFLEGAIALAVVAVVFGILAWRQSQATRDARDAAAAANLRTVQQVVASVITRNFPSLLSSLSVKCENQVTSCPAGSTRRITRQTQLTELLASGQSGPAPTLEQLGLFPPGFQFTDPYGQGYEVWLKRTGEARLEGLVVTVNGTPPARSRAIEIATRADPSDGGVISEDGNSAEGAYGAWSIDLRSYTSADPTIPPPGARHVAALLRFDESRAYADYVHRDNMGGGDGAEPQTMHTTLNMNGQSIAGAGNLTVQFSVGIRADTTITVDNACASDRAGRVASTATGEPVICMQEATNTFNWRRIALLPRCTSSNQFLTIGTDGRLACTS